MVRLLRQYGPPGAARPLEVRAGSWFDVVGGILPQRLERYHAHPDIARFRTQGWMKDAG